MYTLTFTLKQHTPIIHFQHDQDGATLRATEVKPKLDRFIIERCGGWQNTPNDWKQKKDDPKNQALNLSLHITQVYNDNKSLIEEGREHSYPPFFANMGGVYRENMKSLNYTSTIIKSDVKTLNKELYDYILANNILPDFFALNNFGTRQSKGFGSFSVKKVNGEDISFPRQLFRYSFAVTVDNKVFENYKILFKKIDFFYRTLRSGINLPKVNNKLYFKSLLFMYVNSCLEQQWDKKTIKKHFLDTEQTAQCAAYGDDIVCDANTQDDENNLKNYRDLMGLSSKESWFFNNFTLEKNEAENINGNWVEKTSDNIEIKRFKSPMFFKILRTNAGFRVYFTFIVHQQSYEKYTNSTFLIKTNRNSETPFTLPFYKGFDYFAFMDWCINNIDIENHFFQSGNNRDYDFVKETIIDIYNQLKEV